MITVDEIRQALWPDQVFVDFEHGVGIAIKKLRDALGDDPVHPFFIETIRRRGYRFIAPVTLDIPQTLSPGHIVGRDHQLNEIDDCLQAAIHQKRQVVFISGEAGIGKTALVDEFIRRTFATHSSLHVARGQCVEGYGRQEAYYPILEALGGLCRAPGGDAYIEHLSSLAPTWFVQFPSLLKRQHREQLQREVTNATRGRMLREIEEALEAMTAAGPLVLVFEDLQWMDHASVDLISVLARHRAPARLLLIGTFRPLELAQHPLKEVKQDLLIHHLARKIALGPLSEAEVGQYLAVESPGAPVPEGLAKAVYQHSEGNPLFMIAALEHMTLRGVLSRDERGWHIRQPLDQIAREVPESLWEMIETQIIRLSAEERKALEVASVQGVSFSSSACAAPSTLEPGAFEDLCEALSRRHHIIRSAAPKHYPNGTISTTYEFVHALYREVFYQRQLPGGRAILHHRVGERLEELFDHHAREGAAELADHFEKALDWERAVRYLRLAADNAIRRYAHLEGAAMLERALQLVKRLPDDQRSIIETEILEKIGAIHVASTDLRSIDTYEALRARAVRDGRVDVEVRALTRMAFPLSWISATRCIETVERALELSTSVRDPLLRATTRASCYALLISVGPWNPRHADEFHRAFHEIQEMGDELLVAIHRIDHSAVLFSESNYRQSHRAAVEGLAELANHEPNISLDGVAWRGHAYAAWSLVFLGEWGQALREIASAIATARNNSNERRVQSQRLLEAWLRLFALDFDGALSLSGSIVEKMSDRGEAAALRLGRTLAGAAEAGLGNHERALDLLLRVREEMDEQPLIRDAYWRVALESSLADIWLAKGELERARLQAERFLEVADTTADRTWHALAWEFRARLAMAENDLALARICVSKAFDMIADFEAPLAAWRVDGAAAELCELEGERELAEAHRRKKRATILRLASSLAGDELLQHTFLAATLGSAETMDRER